MAGVCPKCILRKIAPVHRSPYALREEYGKQLPPLGSSLPPDRIDADASDHGPVYSPIPAPPSRGAAHCSAFVSQILLTVAGSEAGDQMRPRQFIP